MMYGEELQVAIAAVREAAKVVAKARGMLDIVAGAAQKADQSPVTGTQLPVYFAAADVASQIVITRAIVTAFPAASFIAEEDAGSAAGVEGLVRQLVQGDCIGDLQVAFDENADCFWTIDPIDGTKGFLRAGGQYAICVALMKREEASWRPVVSVLGCPEMGGGVLLYAVRGHGAYQTGLFAESQPLRLPLHALGEIRACQGFEKGHSDHSFNDAVRAAMDIGTEPILMDSQCKYALLARGDAHLYIRRSPPGYRDKLWDHAPGALVLEEAGGAVCSVDGSPLVFSNAPCVQSGHGIMAFRGVDRQALVESCRHVLSTFINKGAL